MKYKILSFLLYFVLFWKPEIIIYGVVSGYSSWKMVEERDISSQCITSYCLKHISNLTESSQSKRSSMNNGHSLKLHVLSLRIIRKSINFEHLMGSPKYKIILFHFVVLFSYLYIHVPVFHFMCQNRFVIL